jgi:hypothetical protein
MLSVMSITQTQMPIEPALTDGRDLHARTGDHQSETEAAFLEVAQLMGKVSEMVKDHPEWRRQKPAERMDSVLAALKRL